MRIGGGIMTPYGCSMSIAIDIDNVEGILPKRMASSGG
jgi:hypothetical protein